MVTEPILKLDARDNVALVALTLGMWGAVEPIASGHKIALTDISAGASIVK